MSLFQDGDFTSAAGLHLSWKIECDALTLEDWQTIAKVAAPHIGPFHYLFGVPTGGHIVKAAFSPYRDTSLDNQKGSEGKTMLVVDDVWTTGKSLYAFYNKIGFTGHNWKGFVGFARGPYPKHRITAFMTTEM